MNKIYTSFAAGALALAAIMPLSASAKTFTQATRNDGTLVQGTWETISGNMATDTSIMADTSKAGSDVAVSVCTYDMANFSVYSCQSGYAFGAASLLTVNKLDSVVLKPISVDLYDYDGNYQSTVTVSAVFIGFGKTTKSTSTYKTEGFGYKFSNRSQTIDRQATGAASVNNSSVSGFQYGSIEQFKTLDISKFK